MSATACVSGRLKFNMWNDRDTPIAYLITFRCYGTWLHGDTSGSVNKFNDKYSSPFIKTSTIRETENKNKLKGEAVKLNSKQRKIVEQTIREVSFKGLGFHALKVRTIIFTSCSTGSHSAKSALSAFKWSSTRNLKQNIWNYEHSPWSDKGSERFLWNEKSLEIAMDLSQRTRRKVAGF